MYTERAFTLSPGELNMENLAHIRAVTGHLVFHLFNNLYFEDKQQPNEG